MIRFFKSLFSCSSAHRSNAEYSSILKGLFDERFYLENNPDVAKGGMDALDHYLRYGFKERRLPCDESSIAASVMCASENGEYVESVSRHRKPANPEKSPEIFNGRKLILPFHSKGNFFFKEISQHIADAAQSVGVDAQLIDEHQFRLLEPAEGLHCLFVAPQEFFFLGRKERLHQHAKAFMPNATYLLAEQPQTVFFLSQLEYIFDDVHIVDMNFHAATYLQSLGVDCHYLPLDWSESLAANKKRHFGPSADGMYVPQKDQLESGVSEAIGRPIDAVFIGNGCKRRQKFFSEHAAQFSNFDMAIFMPDWKVPHAAGGLATLDANDSIALCQRSKIFLNIHRDNFEYFEWHRICMRGFLSGSLVLTEPVFKVPEFQSGVHYLECRLEEMPEKIDWLLNTEEGRQQLSQISVAGQKAYLETSMADSLGEYLAFIDESKP